MQPTRNACFPLVMDYTHAIIGFSLAMVYTHAMLILHWSQLTPMHSLFSVIILLILSMTGCICQQYLLGSSLGQDREKNTQVLYKLFWHFCMRLTKYRIKRTQASCLY